MNKDFLQLRKEVIDKVSYITRSPTSFVRLWTPLLLLTVIMLIIYIGISQS